jgi:hypothetical protein
MFKIIFLLIIVLFSIISITNADIHSILTSTSSFIFDENEHLLSNWLIYSNKESCKSFIENNIIKYDNIRELAPINDILHLKIFGNNSNIIDDNICYVAGIEQGVEFNLIEHVLPKMINSFDLLNNDSSELFIDWLTGTCNRVEIGFINQGNNIANLYWLKPNTNERVVQGTLGIGEKNVQWRISTLGHIFEVEDSITKETLGKYVVNYNSFFVVICAESKLKVREVYQEVKHISNMEYSRSRNVKRTFTDIGFAKGRLPNNLWASMNTFYYNNRNHLSLEEWWSKNGLYVNWWEKDVFMIVLPSSLKRYWQNMLKVLVENWSGVELELTDVYGLRQYEDGARLLTHVDRQETHAVSLIINIAQSGMRSPWPLEIYDFADRLHEVYMDEGDIVYYESARCLHGRMNPLQGNSYVNLFAHYRPIDDPNWYKKENPSDSLKPILDIGECHVPKDSKSPVCTGSEFSKLPYLSPHLLKLKSGDDIFNYWDNMNADTSPSTASRNKNFKNEL